MEVVQKPKPGVLYREYARRIIAGERVEVACQDAFDVMRHQVGVRKYLRDQGFEMQTASLGNRTLWMELKQ